MIVNETTSTTTRHPVLEGKRALVVGIANQHSIAYGCARAFHELGAELAVTYLNDKAKPYVEPFKLMGAVVPSATGLRTSRRISHD